MTKPADSVLLIHGLGRTPRSMAWSAARLREAGYETQLVGYPSQRLSLPELAAQYLAPVVSQASERLQPGAQLHFLTHSLGGLLWREWAKDLGTALPSWLGRTVMLAPPNQGAQVAESLSTHRWMHWILGPALEALRTSPGSVAQSLGPVPGDRVGIIMGERALIPLFCGLLTGQKHDGIVTVDEGQVAGMADFITLDADHTFIMRRREVMAQAIHFFRTGKFCIDTPTN